MNVSKNQSKPSVAVIISTYNGAKHFREQLNSLFLQDGYDITLYIRDDGSSDDTKCIIYEYLNKNNVVFIDESLNLGVVGSFFELCRIVDSDYYFFCDQDDYWLHNKISDSLECFKNYNEDIPLLVHTNLKVVDEELNILNNCFYNYTGSVSPVSINTNQILLKNRVIGCSMVANRALVNYIKHIEFDFSKIIMHDWWLALVALSYGNLHYLNKSTILYRQHSTNLCGAGKKKGIEKYFRFFNIQNLKRIIVKRNKVYNQLVYFTQVYNTPNNSDFSKALNDLLEFKRSGLLRRLVFLSCGKLPLQPVIFSLFDSLFVTKK